MNLHALKKLIISVVLTFKHLRWWLNFAQLLITQDIFSQNRPVDGKLNPFSSASHKVIFFESSR